MFLKVLFDFHVYQVYHKREDNKFYINIFLVTAPGHSQAQAIPGDHEKSFNDLIAHNKLLSYWRTSKRSKPMSSDKEYGTCDYISTQEITRQQAAYFDQHRMIG